MVQRVPGSSSPSRISPKNDGTSRCRSRPAWRWSVCKWRRGMRRQRRSSLGPPTKAYPQRYFEEAERREGRRWQAEHGELFCRQTTRSPGDARQSSRADALVGGRHNLDGPGPDLAR